MNQVHLRKEAFKFAAAHMTVFPDGSKESLHGHNYAVEVSYELRTFSLGQMLSFSNLKAPILAICKEWDEKFLLARGCPFLEIRSEKVEVEFTLCQKRYVIPADEVLFLGVENITTEELAQEFSRQLLGQLSPEILKKILCVAVKIEESPGQGATVTKRITQ